MLTDLHKRNGVFTVAFFCFITLQTWAQNPVLKHAYTFDDGTARDIVGNADGVLNGGEIKNGQYITTKQGQFIQLPAGKIKLNTYSALTLEAYIVAGKGNGDNTMLSYFGNENEVFGADFIFQSAKNSGYSVSAICCKNDTTPWTSTTFSEFKIIQDGLKHHLVTTFDNISLKFYVDGILVNSQTVNAFPLNRIENLGTQVAYLAKSGFRADPTWIGKIDAFNIYEGILDAETIDVAARNYLPSEVINARSTMNASQNIKIDSLKTLIATTQNNEEKVRWLNDIARQSFFNLDFETGFDKALEARELAQEIDFKDGEILFQFTLAAFFGNWSDWYNYFSQKAQLMENGDRYDAPAIPANYPPSFYNAVQLKNLESLYKKYEDENNKQIQAVLKTLLAYAYYYSYKKDEQFNAEHQALTLYKELGDPYPVLLLYNYLNNDITDIKQKEDLKKEMQNYLNQLKNKNAIGPLNFLMANIYRESNQAKLALNHYLSSIHYFESINDSNMLANVYGEMRILYGNLEMHSKQIEMADKQIALLYKLKRKQEADDIKSLTIWPLRANKEYDKAREYIRSLAEDTLNTSHPIRVAQLNDLEGLIAIDFGNYQEAIPRLKEALQYYVPYQIYGSCQWVNKHLAVCYYHLGEFKTALTYANKSLDYSDRVNQGPIYKKEISHTLYRIYEGLGNESLAFKYLKAYEEVVENESSNQSNQGVFETLMSNSLQESQEEIDRLEQERALKEQQTKTQRLWIFSVLGALFSVLFLAFILYRSNKHKQKANTLLHKQKREIETTYEQLKATQSQLIQSEKMASLGELTAGIAHEIQNPLNFVNNFSDLNTELLEDMELEIKNGNLEEIQAIAKDLKENEQKISHHGKRAESIVKGMLQHSRSSSGQKEPTDINTLADEYLRLSYHGLRAKDKSFNADFKMDLDDKLPSINVVPQDFGRVLLNLINNAFYTVNEKAKTAGDDYKPMVTVSTRKIENRVEIAVKDNGNGIPESIKEKIFQPFFTTKPTGSGTGLGLSLSYDIVKVHGGELKVESVPGEGSQFVILLPENVN